MGKKNDTPASNQNMVLRNNVYFIRVIITSEWLHTPSYPYIIRYENKLILTNNFFEVKSCNFKNLWYICNPFLIKTL
jgi:hypothetical protein